MRIFLFCFVTIFSTVAVTFSLVAFFAFPISYKVHIRQAATAYNIDPALVASIIRAESGFKTKAISGKGAIGLMQIMPSTSDYVVNIDKKAAKPILFTEDRLVLTDDEEIDLTNPRQNIFIGTYYLRYLLDRFGDLKTALIAYNAGEGNVTKWLGDEKSLASSPYPETNRYVEKVLNGKNFYKYRI